MKNIYALTQAETNLPAYISINKLEGGEYSVTVRSSGDQHSSTIRMSFMDALKMQSALLSLVSMGED